MKELTSVLAASALLAGLVGLWVTNKNVEARRGEETRRLTERIEELSSRLEKASGAQRLAASRVPNNHEGSPSAAPSALVAAGLSEPTSNVAEPLPADAGAARVSNWDEMEDNAEAQFLGEPYDRAWSAEAAASLRGKVSSRLPHDSHLRSLECRESLCRLETSHPDADQYEKFQRESLSAYDFGWRGPMFFSELKFEKSGQVNAITYLIRPGRALAFAPNGND